MSGEETKGVGDMDGTPGNDPRGTEVTAGEAIGEAEGSGDGTPGNDPRGTEVTAGEAIGEAVGSGVSISGDSAANCPSRRGRVHPGE